MVTGCDVTTLVAERLLARNAVNEAFFAREAPRLARACQEMSERFLRGGRLLAFGRGPYATDAQHVAVEFVHPVIVGKRALPALDVSIAFQPWLDGLLQPADIVMGFGPPEGDPAVLAALDEARRRQAMTFMLPGPGRATRDEADPRGGYAVESPSPDPFMHQEAIELLYHTLWETVHVFFEHRELGHDVGAAGFLYPFLGQDKQSADGLVADVAASILMKVKDDAALRTQVARESAEQIGKATRAIDERIRRGGRLILFGNGGSATDANDWAIDCVAPPAGYRPIPAISLALEPANLTGIANDVGFDVTFLRQLLAHVRTDDVVVGISTSGGSRNVMAAIEAARTRGALTVALLGYDGGEILRRGLTDWPIVVRSDYIPRIQEVQASIYHVMREALEALRDA